MFGIFSCEGKLQVMRVVHFFDLPLMQYLKFYRLAWIPSDGLKNTNLVERRVNGTNETNAKIDK